MPDIKLSVIIPSYNESENLKKGVLDQIETYLKTVDFEYEVIIVDDGSKDESVTLISKNISGKKNFRLVKNTHGGKANTVITGLLLAKGEYALFTDMDQATPISEVEKFFPQFKGGFDIVIGSRHGREGAPLLRKLMAFVFATYRNILLGLPYSDTQCGFKAFNRVSREEIFTKMQKDWQKSNISGAAVNAGFDVESLFWAKKLGFKVAEVPVQWHHVGTERVQMVQDSLDAIKDTLRMKIGDLQGKYVKH